jgi:hypothetical protein
MALAIDNETCTALIAPPNTEAQHRGVLLNLVTTGRVEPKSKLMTVC